MEKTFEELIEENTNWTKATLSGYEKTISTKKCLELLQQVREVTIAECLEIADKGYCWASTYKKIECLPTDRIKLTEQ